MYRAGIAFLLALAWLHSNAAAAADAPNCNLRIVNTVPIQVVAGGARPLVTVAINGTEKKFLLDTGGAMSQISAATVQELKLPVTESEVKMLDLYGNASTSAARIETFTLGRLQDKSTRLPIMTLDGEDVFAGILAADYMGKYDIELDFTGGKMNYFAPEHCPGKVVYWPSAAIAIVPMLFRDNHLNLDVTLDGRPLRAMIDTGAPQTSLSMGEARRGFGLKAEDANKAFEHIFQKLSFEGLEVGNPHILILPDKVGSKDRNNDFVTGSRVHRVDDNDPTDPVMLIGMNVLSKLRFYVAFSESKIYITPASAPPPSH